MTFAMLVKKYRKSAGLTQTELAEKSDQTRAIIMHIETGNQRVFLEQAFKIMNALRIPSAELGKLKW